jgi:uncharacterized protein YcfJ
MKRSLQTVLAAAALAIAGHAAAQIALYEGEGFRGRSITTNERIWNLQRQGFDDRTSSIVVQHGRWEVCEYPRFEGRCWVLRRGEYPSLRQFGMNNQISSVRPVEPGRRYGQVQEIEPPPPVAVVPPPPPPQRMAVVPVPPPPQQEWRRRPDEQIFQVPVTSVREVVGPPSQRCWVERQPVAAQPAPGQPNIGGAVVGGLIGGILGHQIGGGSGKDLATIGGAVAGAAVGSNVNGGAVVGTQDVQRCQAVPNAQPAYYDVIYNWRGVDHHVQMTSPPGPTILVNGRGEPRV